MDNSLAASNTLNRVQHFTDMVDAAGTTKNAYTAGGFLWTEDGPFSSDTVTNTYNNRLRTALSLAQPTGKWTNGFAYDAARRLTNVTSQAGSFAYLLPSTRPSSLVTRLSLPDTSYITNTYDSVARLTGTWLKNSSHSTLNSHEYTYNPANQRTQQVFGVGSTFNYTYDAIGQLTFGDSATAGEDRRYVYDAAWNLNYRTNNATTYTFKVDAKNQLTNATPVSFQTYDANGNLTTFQSGYGIYTYDDENRLVSALYYTYWKSGFWYDGLGRLRTRIEYYWNAGSWWTNTTTRYIYDGMRVIQERDASNPQVSYTRGNDLSGSLEGAGGIGGLLARSHAYQSGSGNFTNHNYYHADGNGNITYLVNSSQTLAASYRYDPYGNSISSSGSLASANVYRFSSKEIHVNSGLYYYGYRWYHPNLQRWLGRDPLGEFPDGPNLYSFVGNNAITRVDGDGMTWRSNMEFLWDWIWGRGKNKRKYEDGSVQSEEMRNSPPGKKLRDKFYDEGCKDFDDGGYGTYEALWETVLTTTDWGNTAFQVGGFSGATATDNNDGTVTFCIPNTAGLRSASWFHILPNMPDQIHLPVIGPVNAYGRNIKQNICWTEPIDPSKCRKCP